MARGWDSDSRCSSQAAQTFSRSGACSRGLFQISRQRAGLRQPLAEQSATSSTGSVSRPAPAPVPSERSWARVGPRPAALVPAGTLGRPAAAAHVLHTLRVPARLGLDVLPADVRKRDSRDLLSDSPQTVSLRPRSHAWTSPAG